MIETDQKIEHPDPVDAASIGVSAPSEGDTLSSRIEVKTDFSYLSLRVSRIVFVFVAFLLIYFLMPVSDILSYFYSYEPILRQQALFSAGQKLFFLPLGLFLLWQLKNLLEDLFSRQLGAIKIGPFKLDETTVEPNTDNSSLDVSAKASLGRRRTNSVRMEGSLGIQPSFQQDVEDMLEDSVLDNLSTEKVFKNFRGRMKKDIHRLSSISTRNLAIGIAFSIAALFFIASPLIFAANFQETSADVQQQGANAISWLLRYYLPRFGVGLLLQFVGFFFLRLYVANEQDIKHNSNEITNLEAKMIAIQVASQRGDKQLFKPIVENLAKTERNFILKKNEKAVHEDDRRYNDLQTMLATLGTFLDTKRKNFNTTGQKTQKGKDAEVST